MELIHKHLIKNEFEVTTGCIYSTQINQKDTELLNKSDNAINILLNFLNIKDNFNKIENHEETKLFRNLRNQTEITIKIDLAEYYDPDLETKFAITIADEKCRYYLMCALTTKPNIEIENLFTKALNIEYVINRIQTLLKQDKDLLKTHYIILKINKQLYSYYTVSNNNKLGVQVFLEQDNKVLDYVHFFNGNEVVDEIYIVKK